VAGISAATIFAGASAAASVAGTAAKLGGSAKGAQGARRSGEGAAQAYQYQAQVARNNARIAEMLGENAIGTAFTKQANHGMKTAQRTGKITTGQAASGVDINTGSAVQVRAGQRMVDKLDAENIIHQGQLENWGYRNKKDQYESDANLLDMKAQNARIAGETSGDAAMLSGAGSFLETASSLPMKFKWDSEVTGSDDSGPAGGVPDTGV